MELTLSGVTKTFRDRTVVNGISARLTPGIYGLLGANGAGKTTLMRMICGVLDPTAGTVGFDGIPIQNLGERYYARLGYLPQDFNCYPDFTARQFLRYMAAVKGLRGPSAKRRVEEMLDLVNLADAADRRVGGFSASRRPNSQTPRCSCSTSPQQASIPRSACGSAAFWRACHMTRSCSSPPTSSRTSRLSPTSC